MISVGPIEDLPTFEMVQGESQLIEIEFYVTVPVADIHIEIVDALHQKVRFKIKIYLIY